MSAWTKMHPFSQCCKISEFACDNMKKLCNSSPGAFQKPRSKLLLSLTSSPILAYFLTIIRRRFEELKNLLHVFLYT